MSVARCGLAGASVADVRALSTSLPTAGAAISTAVISAVAEPHESACDRARAPAAAAVAVSVTVGSAAAPRAGLVALPCGGVNMRRPNPPVASWRSGELAAMPIARSARAGTIGVDAELPAAAVPPPSTPTPSDGESLSALPPFPPPAGLMPRDHEPGRDGGRGGGEVSAGEASLDRAVELPRAGGLFSTAACARAPRSATICASGSVPGSVVALAEYERARVIAGDNFSGVAASLPPPLPPPPPPPPPPPLLAPTELGREMSGGRDGVTGSVSPTSPAGALLPSAAPLSSSPRGDANVELPPAGTSRCCAVTNAEAGDGRIGTPTVDAPGEVRPSRAAAVSPASPRCGGAAAAAAAVSVPNPTVRLAVDHDSTIVPPPAAGARGVAAWQSWYFTCWLLPPRTGVAEPLEPPVPAVAAAAAAVAAGVVTQLVPVLPPGLSAGAEKECDSDDLRGGAARIAITALATSAVGRTSIVTPLLLRRPPLSALPPVPLEGGVDDPAMPVAAAAAVVVPAAAAAKMGGLPPPLPVLPPPPPLLPPPLTLPPSARSRLSWRARNTAGDGAALCAPMRGVVVPMPGVLRADATLLFTGWPASAVGSGTSGTSGGKVGATAPLLCALLCVSAAMERRADRLPVCMCPADTPAAPPPLPPPPPPPIERAAKEGGRALMDSARFMGRRAGVAGTDDTSCGMAATMSAIAAMQLPRAPPACPASGDASVAAASAAAAAV